MNPPWRRRSVLKAAGTVGVTGAAATLAGCSTLLRDEFLARPVVVQQPHLRNSELFRLLSDVNRVCSVWKGVAVNMELDVSVARRTVSAVSWGVASTSTPDLARTQPPFSLGEFITVSTPKIRPPGLGEQNPAAELTPAEAFEDISAGDRTDASGGVDTPRMVRYEELPSVTELVGSAYGGRIIGAELVEERLSDRDVFEAEVALETVPEDIAEAPDDGVLVAGRRIERPDSYVFLLGWAPMDDEAHVRAVRSLARTEPGDDETVVFDVDGMDAEAVALDCASEEGCSGALEEWVASLTSG